MSELLDILGVLALASLLSGFPWLFIGRFLRPNAEGTRRTARGIFVLACLVVTAVLSLRVAHAAEVDVISGDSFRVGEKEWRIANIDAPQIENTCDAEMKVGLLAQAKLAEILTQGELEIHPTGAWDLRHRMTALVRINGADVGEKMIAAHLAQRHGVALPLCSARPGQGQVGKHPKNKLRGGLGLYRMVPQASPPNPVR